MRSTRRPFLVLAALTFIAVHAIAGEYPLEQMRDAREAVHDAHEAGAATLAAEEYEAAVAALNEAESLADEARVKSPWYSQQAFGMGGEVPGDYAAAREKAIEAKRLADTARKRAETASATGTPALGWVTVMVTDTCTGAKVDGSVTFNGGKVENKTFAAKDGVLRRQFGPGGYVLTVSADGYTPRHTSVEVVAGQNNNFVIGLHQSIALEDNIHFASGGDEILSRSYPVLDDVVKQVRAICEYTQLVVEGHTDSKGDAEFNKELSRKRAAAVARYLMEKGIPANKITTVGLGEEQPIADNGTADGRQKNRRVEFVVK